MNSKQIIGIILILVGAIALAYQGISYTTRDKTLDLGPVHVTTEKTHTIPLPPILGAVALAGGILVLVTAGRSARS